MLGDNIKKFRTSRNITLNNFAKKINLSSGYLSELENNKVKNPTKSKLDLIANGLGVTVSELVKEDAVVTPYLNKMTLDEGINYYNNYLKSINDDNSGFVRCLQLLEWMNELKELREFKNTMIKAVKTIS